MGVLGVFSGVLMNSRCFRVSMGVNGCFGYFLGVLDIFWVPLGIFECLWG